MIHTAGDRTACGIQNFTPTELTLDVNRSEREPLKSLGPPSLRPHCLLLSSSLFNSSSPAHCDNFSTPMNVAIPSSPSSVMTDSESPRPGRKSRIQFDFPIETLRKYSVYRQDDAAKILKVSSITLKRICRRRNYKWTYRAYKAQQRRDKLATQKRQAAEGVQTRRETPPSPSLRIPEVLLSLGQERNKAMNCSPTSVSDVTVATPMQTLSAQFPLTTALRKLPPLSQFLKKHQSINSSIDATGFYQRRLLPSTGYKSSIYGASFHPTAPTFPPCSLARPNGIHEPTHV